MRQKLVLIPALIAAICFIFLPSVSFAAEWSVIGSQSKVVRSFIVDISDNNRIIFNDGSGTYYTGNGGADWQKSITDISAANCSTLIQDSRNMSEYWMGCYPSGLHHSLDGGKTFQKIVSTNFSTEVKRIRQDKNGTLYVNAGYNYRSTDGIIWEKLSGIGSSELLLFPDKENPGTLYLSSPPLRGAGLYKSIDHGNTWNIVSINRALALNVSEMIFQNGIICASLPSAGYGCSSDAGLTWNGFYDEKASVPYFRDYYYAATQNQDNPDNVLVYVGDVYGKVKRIYSTSNDQPGWTLNELPAPLLKLQISQDTIFGSTFNNVPGLWKNGDIALTPEQLKKHPVVLIPGFLGSWEENGKLVLDPLTNTYAALYESLKASGLEEEKFLFAFPYDWRKDNNETAKILKQRIDEAKQKSGESKVDIVAHSMGGLVARAYAESDYYENDIDQIIFLGTPHLGSAKAYVPYESGNVIFGNGPIVGNFFNYTFEKEAKERGLEGQNNVFDYIRQDVPSLQQLLPITDYIGGAGPLRPYPENYPTNNFLDNLDSNKGLLKERKIRTVSIVGISMNNTIQKYDVINSTSFPLWENGEPKNFYSPLGVQGIYYTSGDNTVTTESASAIGDKIITLNGAEHTKLPTEAIMQVEKELPLDSKIVVSDKSTKKGLLVFVHSPIDILITDPLGRRVGTDATNMEINEIDGAFYTNENGMEFAILPDSENGEYKITAKGTDNGNYEIETHYVDDVLGTDLMSQFTGTTSSGKIDKLELDLNIEASSINAKPEDQTPPVTMVTVNCTKLDSYCISDATLSLAPNDDESGVDKTYYSYDNLNWQEYSEELVLSKEGVNEIYYHSLDKAGNVEGIKREEVIIDKNGPIINLTLFKIELTRLETLSIESSIIDEVTGVKENKIFLDDIEINQKTLNLFYYSLGEHTVQIVATDNAGNITERTFSFTLYADYNSTIHDLLWAKDGIKNYGLFISTLNKLEIARSSNKDQEIHFLLLAKAELEDAKQKAKITNECYKILIEDINYLLGG